MKELQSLAFFKSSRRCSSEGELPVLGVTVSALQAGECKESLADVHICTPHMYI